VYFASDEKALEIYRTRKCQSHKSHAQHVTMSHRGAEFIELGLQLSHRLDPHTPKSSNKAKVSFKDKLQYLKSCIKIPYLFFA